MAAKTKRPAKRKSQNLPYTDKQGAEKTLPASSVKQYGDTQWYLDTADVFPQLDQAIFSKEDGEFDQDGRPNILNKNIIVREVIQMTKGPYGPYFAMHVLVDGLGEFSVLTRGDVVSETIEGLSGIEVATGRRIGPGELPVALRVTFDAGKGSFEGYYTVVPPIPVAVESGS